MYVNLTFKVFWQFKELPHLKITLDKKIINCKTGSILKYTTRGYFIQQKYIKRKELNNYIEKITESKLPF